MSAKVKRGTGETFQIRAELFLIYLLDLWKRDESLNYSQRDKRIIELYENGMSMKEISLEFGITAQRVEQILKKAGVATRKYTRSNRLLRARRKKRRIIPKEILLKFYEQDQLPVSEITEKLGVSHPLLYESLEYHNIPKRKTKGIQRSILTEELLRRFYLEENLTSREIAERLGFASITIKKRLSKFGIKKCARQTYISGSLGTDSYGIDVSDSYMSCCNCSIMKLMLDSERPIGWFCPVHGECEVN